MSFESTQTTEQIQETISSIAQQEPNHRLRFVFKCEIAALLVVAGMLLALVVSLWGILPFHEQTTRVFSAVLLVTLGVGGVCAIAFFVRARLQSLGNLQWFVVCIDRKVKRVHRRHSQYGGTRRTTVRHIYTDHGRAKVNEEWYQFFQEDRHYLVFGCSIGSSLRYHANEESVFELPELPSGYRYGEQAVVAESA